MMDERDSQTLAESARQAKRAVLKLAIALNDAATDFTLTLGEALKRIDEKLKETKPPTQ